MRIYWRPGATPMERLEGYLGCRLRTRKDVSRRVAALLSKAVATDSSRQSALREAFAPGSIEHPAEAMGVARAVLFLCGVCDDAVERLTGDPKADLRQLLAGEFLRDDLNSPSAYAVPDLVEAYCHMGASFARGMDRAFLATTGQPLAEHLYRAITIAEPAA